MGVDDKANGLAQCLAGIGTVGHAVDLSQEERGEAVSVHGSVGSLGCQQTALGTVGQDERERPPHGFAVGSSPGHVAVGHERQRREPGNADVRSVV